ncbi:unnamed protein product [Effrenium voratum]|uniref:Chalcone isomerase domain-containing protein n=1 Tax=Effrenium voratum TaxID=2562239 RepID=A0AA36JL04_9DINO|nr:unnamed protein product [Effrenium voratum]CAJ1408168.1 unnamed protein product [Effrenium voratum]CAJ1455110.1 unnamed protein product [Effrenium voratum]
MGRAMAKWRHPLLVLLLGLSVWSFWESLCAVEVKEPLTGAAFPQEMGKQQLVASGVRRKYGLKVYAVAFYLDGSSRLWGPSGHVTARRVVKEAPGRASLRIVITSSLVTKQKLSQGLRESLRPRLLNLVQLAEAEEVLQEFEEALAKGPPLKRGTELVFTLKQSGLRLQMGKRYAAEIAGKAIVEALLATYVDAKAVAPEFKEHIFQGLARK